MPLWTTRKSHKIEKLLGCATLSAAFVNGFKAVAIMNGEPMISRVLKFSYDRLVSQTKLDIFEGFAEEGWGGGESGGVEGANRLREAVVELLYSGAENSQRLVDLGLVEVRRAIGRRALLRRQLWLTAYVGQIEECRPI